jgi:hypothetical protein
MSNNTELAPELIKMLSGIFHKERSRLRVAVTADELAGIKQWIRENAGSRDCFVRGLRGTPLYIEDDPKNPEFILEDW